MALQVEYGLKLVVWPSQGDRVYHSRDDVPLERYS